LARLPQSAMLHQRRFPDCEESRNNQPQVASAHCLSEANDPETSNSAAFNKTGARMDMGISAGTTHSQSTFDRIHLSFLFAEILLSILLMSAIICLEGRLRATSA